MFFLQARKAQSEKENAKKSEVLEHPPRPQTPAPSVLAVSNPLPKKSEEKLEDKENAPPKVAPIVSEKMVAQECQEDKKELREEKPCAKCTKRRLADVQPQSDSTLCESTSPNKRARHDSESSSDKCDIKSPDVSCHEPMQTEQISNLVNRFNSGLSGLLGSSHNENTKNNCQNDSIVPSCGTQVIFSESLGSRPVIALTV